MVFFFITGQSLDGFNQRLDRKHVHYKFIRHVDTYNLLFNNRWNCLEFEEKENKVLNISPQVSEKKVSLSVVVTLF